MVPTRIMAFLLLLLTTMPNVTDANARRHAHRACREPSNLKMDAVDRLHDSFYQIPPLTGTVANLSTIPALFQDIRRTILTGQPRCPSWEEAVRHHDGNVCPFHYVLNFDDNRLPNTMVETKCNCVECLSSGQRSSGLLLDCQPILYFTKVFRRTGCNDDNVYTYEPIWEPLQVGCRCARALSRTAQDQLRSAY